MDDVRKKILQVASEKDMNLAYLSQQIGKNHAYLQQFIKRGIPKDLPEKVRRQLANVLGVSEVHLGGAERDASGAPDDSIHIPEHDVRASAGSGSIVEHETIVGSWPMPRRYIRDALSLRSTNLAIIEIIGDSMMPTLHSGDKIIVDLNDKNIAQPGIFALFDGDFTVVKRIEKVPATELVRIKSDNPNHGVYDVPADLVSIAGRVVWFGRRI